MQQQRVAIAWTLVVLVGLLLGLLVLVVAVGVARHVRRQRDRAEGRTEIRSRQDPGADEPSSFSRRRDPHEEEDDS